MPPTLARIHSKRQRVMPGNGRPRPDECRNAARNPAQNSNRVSLGTRPSVARANAAKPFLFFSRTCIAQTIHSCVCSRVMQKVCSQMGLEPQKLPHPVAGARTSTSETALDATLKTPIDGRHQDIVDGKPRNCRTAPRHSRRHGTTTAGHHRSRAEAPSTCDRGGQS